MSDRSERELGGPLAGRVQEQAGLERYQRRQREIRRGAERGEDGARPREFDTNGFPIPQSSPSFVERVARLLNPF